MQHGLSDAKAAAVDSSPPGTDHQPDAAARKRRRTRIGIALLALVTIVGAKFVLDVQRGQRLLQKNALIRSNLSGGEWLCSKEHDGAKGEVFSLSVNPGVQVATPNGPIHGAGSLDSTTHSPASSPQFYIGSSELVDDAITLRWRAHWTDPAELRALALSAQRTLSADPARYATDLSQQNYVSNLQRGITVFDKPIMEETITVESISRENLVGTMVTSTGTQTAKARQPIECKRALDSPGNTTATLSQRTQSTERSAEATSQRTQSVVTPAKATDPTAGKSLPTNAQATKASNPNTRSSVLADARLQQAQSSAAKPASPPNATAPGPMHATTTQPADKPVVTAINAGPTVKIAADARAPQPVVDEARSFVDEWFRTSSTAQRPDDVLRFYAPEVRYYDRGVVSPSYVRRDKQYYFDRWPVRRTRIIGPINIRDSGNEDKVATFNLWYRLESSRERTLEGTTPVRLVLGKRDGRLMIVGESN